MKSNSNKVAIVTGGSRGLGKDMAIQLARKNFDIILTYHLHHDAAQKVVDEIKAIGRKAVALKLDVANASGFDGFVNEVKEKLKSVSGTSHVHTLDNNASIADHRQ